MSYKYLMGNKNVKQVDEIEESVELEIITTLTSHFNTLTLKIQEDFTSIKNDILNIKEENVKFKQNMEEITARLSEVKENILNYTNTIELLKKQNDEIEFISNRLNIFENNHMILDEKMKQIQAQPKKDGKIGIFGCLSLRKV